MFRSPCPVHRLTRRQALKLGAATAALGRPPPRSPPLAPARAEAFTLDLAAPRRGRRRVRRLAHDARLRRAAPLRPDRPRLARAAAAPTRRSARAGAAGAGAAGRTCTTPATTAPTPAAAPAGTDPAWTGAADQFQLRLQGPRARPARALRPLRARRPRRARRHAARRTPPRRQVPGAPAIITARAVGRRRGRPAARAPDLRPGPARVRPPHGQRERLRARGVGRDRARHRQVPPRPQRLERPRLQLPRRPVRPDLRGPRGRHRPGDRRRAGAGLQQRLDRRRVPRHVHRRSRRPRPGWTRWRASIGWKLSLHGIPVAGRGDRHVGRRRDEQVPPPARRSRSSASPATATATRRACPGDVLYAQLPDLRARAARYARPVAGVTCARRRPSCAATATAVLSGVLRFADGSSRGGRAGRDPLRERRGGAARSR